MLTSSALQRTRREVSRGFSLRSKPPVRLSLDPKGTFDVGLFGRRKSVLPSRVLAEIAEFGEAHLNARAVGKKPDIDRFGWSDFVGPVSDAVNSPKRDEAVAELYQAARSSPCREYAALGAYALLAEGDAGLRDPRFLELLDEALQTIHSRGLSSGHLTRYEADRWIEVHGDLRTSFDGLREADVPAVGSEPASLAPAPGETRMLALTAPLPDGNAFYVETRSDRKMTVYSERLESDDNPIRKRYDETYLGEFDAYEVLLRAVGEMFGTPPYWFASELEAYFPLRRS